MDTYNFISLLCNVYFIFEQIRSERKSLGLHGSYANLHIFILPIFIEDIMDQSPIGAFIIAIIALVLVYWGCNKIKKDEDKDK